MELTNERILQHQISKLQVEVSMSGYTEFGPQWRESRDQLDFYRLGYVVKGQARIELDGREYELQPGKLFFLNQDGQQNFGTMGKEKLGVYWCHFRLRSAGNAYMRLLNFPIIIDIKDEHTLIQQYEAMINAFSNESVASMLKIKAALLQIISMIFDEGPSQYESSLVTAESEKWHDVLKYIEQNLQHNIQIEDLARVTYLHPNYFITAFKSTMGCSPIQYVTQRRLAAAMRLLKATYMPVSEVAARVGMLSHYLSRLFKRHTGITPLQYRRMVQVRVSLTNGENSLRGSRKGDLQP